MRVQSARFRDEVTDDYRCRHLDSCTHHFDAAKGGPLIDQPFQPRITEGIIRCYVVKDEVVGFAAAVSERCTRIEPSERKIFGLPAQKTMFAADEPTLSTLRRRVESEWIPAMRRLVEVDAASLPALWDADFLLGPRQHPATTPTSSARSMSFRASVPAGSTGQARACHARGTSVAALKAALLGNVAGRDRPPRLPGDTEDEGGDEEADDGSAWASPSATAPAATTTPRET